MHTKSSINIKPVSGNSEVHNLRIGNNAKLNYIRQDRTHLNESWVQESTTDARNRVEETYKTSVGQKMQAKATPIREGVVNLGKDQNMDTLKQMSSKLQDRFGIKTIQIHIHEDEGYHQSKYNKEGDEIKWKQNRHAHVVFDWTDEKGKSLKLNKGAMAEMQTIVAESLGMERGQSSDKKHLNSMEYKLQEMEKDALELEKNIKELRKMAKRANTSKSIAEGIKRFARLDNASVLSKDLKSLKIDYSNLKMKAAFLTSDRDRYFEESKKEKEAKEAALQEKEKAIREKEEVQIENLELKEELKKAKGERNSEVKARGLKLANEALELAKSPVRITNDFEIKYINSQNKGTRHGM